MTSIDHLDSGSTCLGSLNTSLAVNNLVFSRLNDEMSKLEDIAEGSFGVVRKGVLDIDQCTYTVKQSKRPISGEGDLQQRLQEIYALSTCDHLNILRYYEGWVEERSVFLRNEYMSSGSAAKFSRPVPEKILRSLLLQIARALHQLHCMRIVHRDVKPENILSIEKSDGTFIFKLCDFGLARPVWRNATGEQFKGINDDDGDRNFISPEALSMCENVRVGYESDIYALGATCVALMGGDPSLVRSGTYPTTWVVDYSSFFRRLIVSMTSQKSSERPDAFTIACLLGEERTLDDVGEKRELIETLKAKIEALR
ncbi:protein kinase [Angomonas deanei]|uniref:Protein kinase domain/Protein tyrosine kinase/Lipopolysaccharide kinase (Kdo/WaaP) family, putative n=1 Tax=Angomonas deanei TaxID=59799 RepID=A0A7G2CFQ8_9TRYP|nr:protein kinase [Angomonas deanei]CAD2218660.1 Protein kinase domain/Protein tyrosine kinase/Lipopolysaccharide kinase (Kdo/WaaP) family, putative [Angomonas deanei]|eukprot:EPY40209.1 protein kinase [Angomonas deanei]